MRGGFVLPLVVIAAWYAAFSAAWDAARKVQDAFVSEHEQRVSAAHVDSTVGLAMGPEMAPHPVRFNGDFDTPFRPQRIRRVRTGGGGGRGPAKPAEPAVQLTLNGILLRASKPHAILGDEQGGTHIRAEGDSLFGHVISRIEADRVVLRHGRTTTEIEVKQ